ncbi:MAG: hypothetical protein IH995_02245 [Proteobacteria bacterium]|nr:hypothetical protein [Pseudomonadota bacterium]
MVGWFAKKGQNSRVYMCVKELKWELEGGDSLKRATILALAQYFRFEIFDDCGISMDVIDRPLDYSREDLLRLYEILETVRNQNTFQIEQTKKTMIRFGMELPQFSIEHAKNTSRALEVWMCTLGAGITPDKRDDVRIVWSRLASSFDYIEEAILHIRQIEKKTAEMTGVSDAGMFSTLNSTDWVELCRFVPSVFLKELNLD